MDIHTRLTRLAIWSSTLLAILAVFVIGLRAGIGLFILIAALAVLALLAFRIAVLLGAPWALSLASILSAGIVTRLLPPPPRTDDETVDVPEVEPQAAVLEPAAGGPAWDSGAALSGAVSGWLRRFDAAIAAQQTASGGLALGQRLLLVAALLALGIPFGLRAFRLADLQAEVYGDINIVFEYLMDIRAGLWPFKFELSSGPLYHYLIMPIIDLAGLSYFGIKVASVSVSMLILGLVFVWSRRLVDHTFALITVFVMGVSSWFMVFSRLGNSQIVVPLLTAAALWLMTRHLQNGRMIDLMLCAAVSALGLYGYPQSFVITPVMLVTLLALKLAGHALSWRAIGVFVVTALIVSAPFMPVLINDTDNITGGYIVNKVAGADQPALRFISNFGRAMLAFHVEGDAVFRSNERGVPHLDAVSGLLMLAGVVFWLLPARRRWSPMLLVPYVLLQVPSMLVVNFEIEVPSASRTLGVAPIVYLWVASGLWWLAALVRERTGAMPASRFEALTARPAAPAVALVLASLALILGLNIERYFTGYISGLPYANTPVARILTNYVDTLPAGTNVYLYRCCWESGMPEPKSIQYEMASPKALTELPNGSLTCDTLDIVLRQPAVLFWDHKVVVADPALAACADRLPGQLHVGPDNLPVFHVAALRSMSGGVAVDPLGSPLPPPPGVGATDGLLSGVADAAPGTIVADTLVSEDITLGGRAAAINYSLTDLGSAQQLIDNDPSTPMRGRRANPFVLDLVFLKPELIQGVRFKVQTSSRLRVYMTVIREDGSAETSQLDVKSGDVDPVLSFPVSTASGAVSELRFEFLDRREQPSEGYHFHIYDLAVE